MRNVAQLVSERLLPQVRRPGQYVGLEVNARCPDPAGAEVTVALAFPDAYAVGIGHLGSQVLYHLLNDLPGVACDRAYCPRPDAEEVMRREGVPLFGWESRCALRDFDVLGFSLAYEMCVTNVLTMLDLAGVPLRAEARGPGDPIVVGGDALADSPEAVAEFFDLLLPGDGEEPLRALVELLRRMKPSRPGREELLLAAAKSIPSAYAPRFYRPQYGADGTLQVPRRLRDDVPETIARAHVARLDESPPVRRPLVPLAEAVHDRAAVEVMRGCPNSCRFCQAGATRLPVRTRDMEAVVAAAHEALDATGYDELALLSLSTSDYPRLPELIDRLNAELADRHVSVSLPSLRADAQLRLLPRLTSRVRKGGLTIAAEAASPRLRAAIGKDITDEDMLEGVRAAYREGFRSVKVYFLAGLPGEEQADVDAVFDLCLRLADARREVDGQRGAVSASVSWLVPKPHTPMQWCAMRRPDYFFAVRRRLREVSRRSPVRFRFHRIERSVLEAVICRGDRRVGAAIEAAWRAGARMDAWDEHFDYGKWDEAFRQTGIDPAFYAHRPLALDEPLPWSHVTCRRPVEFLRSEYRRMVEALGETQPAASP